MYHISDIKKFIRCERLYHLSKDAISEFKPYLRSDESIIDLVIKYLKIDRYFLGERNDIPERFFNNINDYDWFVRTRFMDHDLRINIPVVHKVEGGYDLYYLYSNTSLKELDKLTYSIGFNMLNKQGIIVNNIYIIYLNSDYVMEDELDVDELFVCIDEYKNKKIIDIVSKNDFDYETVIDNIEKSNGLDIEPKKCKYCKQNGLCDFYNVCFKEEVVPDDSILSLVSSKYKNEMYEEGIVNLKDADLSRIEGNRVQYAQIMASKNGGLFVDKLALGKWLEKINVRPISFIDFEWDRYLIPPYKSMKPMDVLCFEFALYYIDENGHMEHKTFVGKKDCRKEFVLELIKNLPKEGPVLAYNADGAECLRLKELSIMYPEYKQELESINSRFIDLATPFIEGLIYDTRMQGNYTLKRIVDICSDYSYKNLDIYDGMEAVYNWRNIDKGTLDNDEKTINDLKEYCSLDAYGLFLVYKWLIEVMINK